MGAGCQARRQSGDVATAPHGFGVPNCNHLIRAPPPDTTKLTHTLNLKLKLTRALPLTPIHTRLIMAAVNWRTINIDALDPDSPANFDLSSLAPAVEPIPTAEVQNNAQQIRQLLRSGDNEGALQGALEKPPYGADDKGKEAHLAAVIEILQSIRQSDMSPMLSRIYSTPGGTEALDVLMKYMYVETDCIWTDD